MSNTHTPDHHHSPDPGFVGRLEWQLGSELRRQQRAGASRGTAVRTLKIAGLMIGSVALGAAAMGASQQLGDAWRRDLLEARLEVQLELAQRRVQAQLDALGLTREQVELGVRSDRDLLFAEFQIAQAEADAAVTALELEELRGSGREPLGALSSPLVDGRDFVTEKIRVRMEVAQHHLDLLAQEEERARRQVEAGAVSANEVRAREILGIEAQSTLDGLAEQIHLRRAYLDGEISAVEAELKVLERETANRVVVLEQQRQLFQAEWDQYRQARGAGGVRPDVAVQMENRVAEIEGQLRLAEAELSIVRRELERRAQER